MAGAGSQLGKPLEGSQWEPLGPALPPGHGKTEAINQKAESHPSSLGYQRSQGKENARKRVCFSWRDDYEAEGNI